MLFSSTIFLFGFLPVVLTLYFVAGRTEFRNGLLIAASLFFYAWGELGYTLLLIGSIAVNYGFGLLIDRADARASRRWVLAGAVTVNLGVLAYFKYADFIVRSLAQLLEPFGIATLEVEPVHLPIGVSFFTFQALTYVVDVYRRDAPLQRNPMHVALYIALFPQLIAGPIIRYRTVAEQIITRHASLDDVAIGVRRFVIGLAKKVLIADRLAIPSDRIFALPVESLSPGVAWLGVTCFGLQVYFDFAGYSDMAIGLGRVFGFRFPENFNAPFVSRSLQEFWRRWHISLSSWFRDYLYVPMSSKGGSSRWHALTLFLVFFLCGLWHGANWNYVVWGLIHGAFVGLERTRFGALRAAMWSPLSRLYTLTVVWFAFVFFRASDLSHALDFVGNMLGRVGAKSNIHPLTFYLDAEVWTVLIVAIAFSGIWYRSARVTLRERLGGSAYGALRFVAIQALLIASAIVIVAGTHNPFVYFRF